eukprot:COSAG04_NODE_25174_length_311_cov_0.735849_1_plen_40_part_10
MIQAPFRLTPTFPTSTNRQQTQTNCSLRRLLASIQTPTLP